tara:strand:- start:171 stop:458 length:288 start_codon:yes stop_codon:yes gene_type:complete
MDQFDYYIYIDYDNDNKQPIFYPGNFRKRKNPIKIEKNREIQALEIDKNCNGKCRIRIAVRPVGCFKEAKQFYGSVQFDLDLEYRLIATNTPNGL